MKRKTIVFNLLDYHPGKRHVELEMTLANGQRVVLMAGWKDVENLHAALRSALQDEAIKRLRREP